MLCAWIGQAVSSRPDVAPPSYTQELEKLQDQIPPVPTDEAMAVMQQDMGLPPSSVFSFLTSEPVAAASLGQVWSPTMHKGRESLLSNTTVMSASADVCSTEARVYQGQRDKPTGLAQILDLI